MLMMRAKVQGHRWVDHPAAAVMEARVPGQWVDRPAAMVMEAREQGRCWIDHPAAAVMEARVQGRHWWIGFGKLQCRNTCRSMKVQGCLRGSRGEVKMEVEEEEMMLYLTRGETPACRLSCCIVVGICLGFWGPVSNFVKR
ncbi:hypothetical protein ACOMHN_055683 [Nucella lapillus]